MSDTIQTFASLLRNARKAVFFGGAGVSTESGVKDFRSADGIYNTVREYGVSPETILSHEFFLREPETFYDFHYNYFLDCDAEPNDAHKALAKLEAKGILDAVITQNIDGLHQAAGSKNVIELHGTTKHHYCIDCGCDFPTEEVIALKGKVPFCPHCGGMIRPDVTLYGEQLSDHAVERAIKAISGADLLIIGGTSLAVYPAAGFVEYYRGENTVLINRDKTPYDNRATLVFHESIAEILIESTKIIN